MFGPFITSIQVSLFLSYCSPFGEAIRAINGINSYVIENGFRSLKFELFCYLGKQRW